MDLTSVIGLLGALVGGAITGGITLMRERQLGTREREAREKARERDLEDRRNAFQRESLLALQEALRELANARNDDYEQRRGGTGQAHSWNKLKQNELFSIELRVARSKCWELHARIFDEEARRLVADIINRSRDVPRAHSIEEAAEIIMSINRSYHQFQARFNELMRSLF